MKYDIRHNETQCRFIAIISDEIAGVIKYDFTEDGILKIPHTEVKTKYQGLGVAALLTEAVLNYAIEEHLKVRPTCSYAIAYIEKHPEYYELIG